MPSSRGERQAVRVGTAKVAQIAEHHARSRAAPLQVFVPQAARATHSRRAGQGPQPVPQPEPPGCATRQGAPRHVMLSRPQYYSSPWTARLAIKSERAYTEAARCHAMPHPEEDLGNTVCCVRTWHPALLSHCTLPLRLLGCHTIANCSRPGRSICPMNLRPRSLQEDHVCWRLVRHLVILRSTIRAPLCRRLLPSASGPSHLPPPATSRQLAGVHAPAACARSNSCEITGVNRPAHAPWSRRANGVHLLQL